VGATVVGTGVSSGLCVFFGVSLGVGVFFFGGAWPASGVPSAFVLHGVGAGVGKGLSPSGFGVCVG
jgi:hypothetical protein